jgi:hypothetical protein
MSTCGRIGKRQVLFKIGAGTMRCRVIEMMARWRVDVIGEKLRHVGTIKAKTADVAIDEAARLFGIDRPSATSW